MSANYFVNTTSHAKWWKKTPCKLLAKASIFISYLPDRLLKFWLLYHCYSGKRRIANRFSISSLVGITRSAPFLVVITDAATFAKVSISFNLWDYWIWQFPDCQRGNPSNHNRWSADWCNCQNRHGSPGPADGWAEKTCSQFYDRILQDRLVFQICVSSCLIKNYNYTPQ